MTTNDVCEVCGKSDKFANGDYKCSDQYGYCKYAQDIAIARAAEIERLRGVVDELRGALCKIVDQNLQYYCNHVGELQIHYDDIQHGRLVLATKEPHK